MGLRPCSVCFRRYRGGAQHAYPAMLAGVDRVQRRHGVCPECFGAIMEFAQEKMHRIGDDPGPVAGTGANICVSCDSPIDMFAIAFFLTAYARGEDRQDFYGEAHPACREDVCVHLGLMDQEALPVAV